MAGRLSNPQVKDRPSVKLGGKTVEKFSDGVRVIEDGQVLLTLVGGYRAAARGLARRGIADLKETMEKIAPLFPADEMPRQLKERCCGGRTQKPKTKAAESAAS